MLKEKRSWWGCGKHVPKTMDEVPEDQRCDCEPKVEREGKSYPPMAAESDVWLVRNIASAVLWSKGKKGTYTTEGVQEDPR